jgi:hypothetical protein
MVRAGFLIAGVEASSTANEHANRLELGDSVAFGGLWMASCCTAGSLQTSGSMRGSDMAIAEFGGNGTAIMHLRDCPPRQLLELWLVRQDSPGDATNVLAMPAVHMITNSA